MPALSAAADAMLPVTKRKPVVRATWKHASSSSTSTTRELLEARCARIASGSPQLAPLHCGALRKKKSDSLRAKRGAIALERRLPSIAS